MTEGDLAAARGLHPGMYGPLDILAAALVRLSQQMASALSARQQLAGRQYALDSLSAATREQAQMLASLDASLRELGLRPTTWLPRCSALGGAAANCWAVPHTYSSTHSPASSGMRRRR